MNPEAPASEPAASFAGDSPAAPLPGGHAPGVVEAVKSLWDDLRRSIGERVKLVGLELRLAGMTLLQLVIYAVMVAVLVVTAWLGLMGAIVVECVNAGLHWAVAIAIGILINLAVAGWLLRSMLKMIERVGMPASLRSLAKAADKPPAAP